MEAIKENKGITLIALVITIIVLLILAGVALGSGGDSIKTAKSNSAIVQLDMVQHAILERNSQYKLTKNESTLVGTKVAIEEVENIASQIEVTLKATDNYYRLEVEDLKKLGITEETDTYIVNYETGEVINETQLRTVTGEVLYTSATN